VTHLSLIIMNTSNHFSNQPVTQASTPEKRFLLPVILLLAVLVQPFWVIAQGNLLINPVRVVFEGNKQREEITLANTGQDTAVYAITLVQYRMTPTGSFEQIADPDPGQYFADPYLRYFPRRVTLAPNESQIVRMQLRRSPDMVDGEYRSHLYFRAVPDERPLGEDPLPEDTTAIGVRLVPIFGITIPVIIRHGDTHVKADFSGLELVKTPGQQPQLRFAITREGNISLYGDIAVTYEAPGTEAVQVGIVRGLAVYAPNTERSFTLPLNIPEGLDLSKGRINIRYSSSSDLRKEVYAETTITLNQ
jgi:hypothetical protein